MGGGRLAPDKLHERNVDSSNATLNTLFGTARQKSWMVGGATPVRPTPRVSEPKASLQQATNVTNNTKVGSLERPVSRASISRSTKKTDNLEAAHRKDSTRQVTDDVDKNLSNQKSPNEAGTQLLRKTCSKDESSRTSRPSQPEVPIIPVTESDIQPLELDARSVRNTACSVDESSPTLEPSQPEISIISVIESETPSLKIDVQSGGDTTCPTIESLPERTSQSEVYVTPTSESESPALGLSIQSKEITTSVLNESIRTPRPSISETSVASVNRQEDPSSELNFQSGGNIACPIIESLPETTSQPEASVIPTSESEAPALGLSIKSREITTSVINESIRTPRFSNSEILIIPLSRQEVPATEIDVPNGGGTTCPTDESCEIIMPLYSEISIFPISESETPASVPGVQSERNTALLTNDTIQTLRPSNSEASIIPNFLSETPSPELDVQDRNFQAIPNSFQSLLNENQSLNEPQFYNSFHSSSPSIEGSNTVQIENSNMQRQILIPDEEQPSITQNHRLSNSPYISPWGSSDRNCSTVQIQPNSSMSGFSPNRNPLNNNLSHNFPTPSLRSKLALIEAQLQSVGGLESLNTGLERPRFQLITEACNSEDLFYVVLHQIFVVWDLRRQEVLNLPGIPDPKILQSGFAVIGKLIHENDQLAPNHKRWFAEFPSVLSAFWQSSDINKRTFINVFLCLEKLSNNWISCMLDCKSRGFPLLVDEIINKLGILSPILQGVLFTATRRNMGIRDEEANNAMDQIFKRDQTEYQSMASRLGTSNQPTVAEIKNRNNSLILRYQTIHSQYQQRLARPNPSQTNSAFQPPVTGPTSSQFPRVGVSNPVIGPQPQINSQNPWGSTAPNFNTWHPNKLQQSTRLPPARPPLRPVSSSTAPKTNRASMNRATNHVQPSSVPLHRLSINSPEQQVNRLNSDNRNSSVPTPQNQLRQQLFVNASAQGTIPQQNSGRPFQPQPMMHQQLQVQGPTTAHWQNPMYQHPPHQNQQLPYQQLQHQHQQVHHQQVQHQPVQHQPVQHLQLQHQQRPPPSQQIQLQRQQQPPPPQQIQLQRQQQIISQQQNHIANLQPYPINPAVSQTRRTGGPPIEVQQVLVRNSNSNGASMVAPSVSTSRNNSLCNNGLQTLCTTSQIPSSNYSDTIQAPPPQQYTSNKIKDDIQLYHQTPVLNRSIFPPLHWVHPPSMLSANRPELNALHQALLRSPQLVAAVLPSDETQKSPAPRYYQAVRGFALLPSIIPNMPISKFEFNISETDICSIPLDTASINGSVPIRKFKQGALQYRLRCVQIRKSETNLPLHEWMVRGTTWPESAYLGINKTQLEIRRKTHHGKDLPIDITQNVLQNGTMSSNVVTFSTTRGRSKMSECSYLLAVEVIEILEHSQILEMCQQVNRLPASYTLDKIKRSLAKPTDDDFEMSIGEISIDLADPFTSCIFKIPVRGNNCLHRECFDLETFLLTRISKSRRRAQPCMVDVWKCPLCGRDARPWQLQVDGYLESIRNHVAEQGNLDVVKSIRVEPDGTWHPKLEKRKGHSDHRESDYSSDGESVTRRNVKQRKSVEVINLDDD